MSFCYFCGKPGFPGTTCTTCGIATPDPSAPDPATTAWSCPRCVTAPLVPIAVTGAEPGVVCHACGRCHGILVTARSWCTLVARPDLASALEASLPPREGAAAELLAILSCPACRQQLERGRFAASSSVVVDVCIAHGMWLDAGELGDVVRVASTRGRTAGAAPARDLAAETRMVARDVMASDAATAKRSSRGLPIFLIVGLVGLAVALVGGLVTFRSFVMVKNQVKGVTSAAAAASGELE